MEDKKKKLEIMDSVLTKMEDIENTQQSLMQKLGQVEVELYDVKSPDLDESLGRVMTRASETLDIVKEAREDFEMKKNAIANDSV